uniref:Uncharacterized protein n=1 Tax=Rhipicephalus zambeziensis TaxID=60191 RepID=A0A224YEP1_9ACAR
MSCVPDDFSQSKCSLECVARKCDPFETKNRLFRKPPSVLCARLGFSNYVTSMFVRNRVCTVGNATLCDCKFSTRTILLAKSNVFSGVKFVSTSVFIPPFCNVLKELGNELNLFHVK